MPQSPTKNVAVILERLPLESRWVTHRWEVLAIVPDEGGEPRTLVENPGMLQRLFPGFEVALHRDEAEGYYLNASSGAPSVFVSVRTDEGAEDPYPFQATLSYNEAARWMDGGERVERAAAYPELAAWMAEWVEANYRPEPKQRRKPRSFQGKDRLRAGNDS